MAGRRRALRPVPVDLGELADFAGGGVDGGDALLDLETGRVWPAAVLDDPGVEVPDVEEDQARWLVVPPTASREGWRDMRDFAESLNGPVRESMLNAIEGRGAFSRFRRALDLSGEDVLDSWLAFREERRLGRARAWLAAEGYTPA
nr:UPF0158 family protein [Motilibacter deserti]